MRFLCLHGMGTSAEIFAAQTSALRQALGTVHEFRFYEGECEVPPANGVEAVFHRDKYMAWYDPGQGATTHRNSVRLLQDIIEDDGPFDGCMGFSQGAALLASLMLSHQAESPFSPPLFRLAVFICGSSALSVSEADGSWMRVDPRALERGNKRIRIPTVHIYGRMDPALQESLRLRDMCSPRAALEYDHGGGHEIPRAVRTTACMAKVIEKGIERALAAQ